MSLSIPSEIYYQRQNEGPNPRITHRYEVISITCHAICNHNFCAVVQIKNVGQNLAADVVVSVNWPIGMVGEGGMLNLSIANIEVGTIIFENVFLNRV